jgi:hypothetical protein
MYALHKNTPALCKASCITQILVEFLERWCSSFLIKVWWKAIAYVIYSQYKLYVAERTFKFRFAQEKNMSASTKLDPGMGALLLLLHT